MLQPLVRSFCVCLSLITVALTTNAQSNLTARANSLQPTADGSKADTDRVRDGLSGPVRRVRTEVVKVSTVSGKIVEDNKRVLLETTEYDLKGTKTQNQYFPVAGSTLTGRETYKYDDKGNISEMTLMNADGSLLSKEVYKYEFDSMGNWVKMTTSVAVVENQKIEFEPTEITYRTIFYYLDASMAKMLQPASNSTAAPTVKTETAAGTEVRVVQLPPMSSADKARFAAVQLPGANLANSASGNSKVVVSNDGEAPPPRLLKPVSGGVLNGRALSLPVPRYPDIARRSRTSGKVEVQVVVDENGNVISAQALSGPAPLREAAADAARHARFSPTKLSGVPVKVAGTIDYNFTLP
jgi:TonB family protein